jgi:hypothetical protein
MGRNVLARCLSAADTVNSAGLALRLSLPPSRQVKEAQMHELEFVINGKQRTAGIDHLVIASWTGRDTAQVEHNIGRLEALGIPRPRAVPSFYLVTANLLTNDQQVDVIGSDASGEVEFVLVSLADGLFVGVGSDHTDRRVEAYSAIVAKQMCPKPISRELWPLEEVREHWDRLVLSSWVTRNGKREAYQEGPVTTMLAPQDLISRFMHGDKGLPVGTAMFCGTLPVFGTIAGGEQFEIELNDAAMGRSLSHGYKVRHLACTD